MYGAQALNVTPGLVAAPQL